MEETVNQKYIQALCALHEDDFTKNILKPLFEAMGYERVDFNGGAYERGRDLIAQRRIPPRKEMYVVYVQSKKIGDIQNTSTGAKLSQLLHQLRQCFTIGINDSEGRTILPNQIYLACPEQISNRLREEIDSQLFDLKPKIYPYDAPLIISDIKEYKPDLLELLTNVQDKLKFNNFLPSDKELLSALKSKNKTNLKDFYSDLSFFVGSFDSNLLFHLKINFNNNTLVIPEEKWISFKSELKYLLEIHNINCIKEDLNLLENEFEKNNRKFQSDENKNNLYLHKKLKDEIDDNYIEIENKIKALDFSLTENFDSALRRKVNIENITEKREIVENFKRGNVDKLKKFKESDSFYSDCNYIIDLYQETEKTKSRLLDIKEKIVEKPYYKVSINDSALTEKINFYKKRYFDYIELINKKSISFEELKIFLSSTQITLSLLAKLKNNEFLLSQAIYFSQDDNSQDRVSISPRDIFATKYDIAVYGGAGVGKTTTLKAYTDIVQEKEDNNLFYIPLNRFVDELKQITQSSADLKDLLIKIILVSKGIEISKDKIEEVKNILPVNLTLILDGLDEIYDTIPDIISAISEFKKNYPSSQLIISSRDCVSYLNEINFLGITLLPFTKEQLNKFIRGWLTNKEKAEELIGSIEKRDLFEHIKTPLLATITCSLIQKGINAPSTENEIYSERLRLLTGEYDLHKNIDRQKQNGDLLRKCAIKTAFFMHKKRVRHLKKEDILNNILFSLSDTHSKELLSDCIEELINPCNILIIDSVTNTYSFGHFRFQEHLASEELKLNRSVDLAELVIHDWWRGALSLYAQHNDISHLIEDTYRRYGNINKAKMTLESMINNSPKQRINDLKHILKQYVKTDRLDDSVIGDYANDDYEYNSFMSHEKYDE